MKSWAFQLTTEEERETPDVVTRMYIYHFFYYFICLCLSLIDPCIGTFIVNGMIAYVLFDSCVTRSFVSLALRNKFCNAPGIWIVHWRWRLSMTV